MNERIRKLAKQAGLEMCGCGCDMPTRQSTKFAELIVRECVKIIEDEAFNNYNKDKQRRPNSFEAGHDSGMFWSVGMIKQHFGVEE